MTSMVIDFSALDVGAVEVTVLEAMGELDDGDVAVRVAAALSVACGAFGDAARDDPDDPLAEVRARYRDALRLHPDRR